MRRIDEIDDAKSSRLVKEKNSGVEDRKREGEIAGNTMQAEIIQPTMRPLADGTVAEDHQSAEKHVRGDRANSDETDVGAQVKNGDVHWHPGLDVRAEIRVTRRLLVKHGEERGRYRERRSL